MREVSLADLITFLENDLKEVIDILNKPHVFEVLLNPYQTATGDYEGHLFYEAHGEGMKRLTTSTTQQLINYPTPKVGDLCLVKIKDDAILNWQAFNPEDFFKTLKLTLCYSLLTDADNNSYLDQGEYYKLNELGNYIAKGYYTYRKPIDSNMSVDQILEILNQEYLEKIDINFKVYLLQVTEDLLSRLKIPSYAISKEFLKIDYTRAEQIIGILASANDKKASKYTPVVEVKIPFYGHRFTGVLPPVSPFPFFAIRKHSHIIKTLEDYVADGVMPQLAADILHNWVKKRMNILVAGGVGSGKTTLLNTLLRTVNRISPTERIGIVEDTPEIQCSVDNSYAITCSDGVNLPQLLKVSLRLSANRLIMGEIRGAEAYTYLKALTSGFRGCMATIHSDGAHHSMYRYEQCLMESSEIEKINRAEIASGINGIVSIQKVTLVKEVNGMPEVEIKRRVTAIRAITGYDAKHNEYEDSWPYKDPEVFMLTRDGIEVKNSEDFASFQAPATDA